MHTWKGSCQAAAVFAHLHPKEQTQLLGSLGMVKASQRGLWLPVLLGLSPKAAAEKYRGEAFVGPRTGS